MCNTIIKFGAFYDKIGYKYDYIATGHYATRVGYVGGHNVLDILSNLSNEGQSIIMVTHDIRGAIRADRIIYLSDGKIVGEFRLQKYKKEDEKSREAQINAWLNSLEW